MAEQQERRDREKAEMKGRSYAPVNDSISDPMNHLHSRSHGRRASYGGGGYSPSLIDGNPKPRRRGACRNLQCIMHAFHDSD